MDAFLWVWSRSWLPSQALSKSDDTPSMQGVISEYTALSFDEIADHFSTIHKQLRKVRQDAKDARAGLAATEKQMEALRARNASQQKQINDHQQNARQSKKTIADLRHQTQSQVSEMSKFKSRLTRETTELAAAKSLITSLQQHNQHVMRTNHDLVTRCSTFEKRSQEALLDLEHYKCVENPSLDSTKLPLTPQPFIVVLVDGDAYGWASTVFSNKSDHNAGAYTASQVQKAVETESSNLPDITSNAKTVVRIFHNESGSSSSSNSRRRLFGQQVANSVTIFRRQFTEALPLYDFLDSGQGKERADIKIKENFQLYLSNPHCQHIFLATCTDNGFARMLEPYRYHVARSKITLVSPGYISREIDTLGFNKTTWPNVFAMRQEPLDVRQFHLRRSQASAVQDAHNKALGLAGTQVPWISALVSDLVSQEEPWTTTISRKVFFYNRSIGIRRPLRMVTPPSNSPAGIMDESGYLSAPYDFVD